MAGRCRCESIGVTGAAANAGSCATVTGAGTGANPFVIDARVSATSGNLLQCLPSGLYVAAPDDQFELTGWSGYLAGAAPPAALATSDFFIKTGTATPNTDANGKATIPFGSAFPNTLLTVVICAGDLVGGVGPLIQVDNVVNTTSQFGIRAIDTGGTPIVGLVRCNWVAIGA